MSEHEFGRYTGKLILEPLQDSQQLKTVLDFGFLEPGGRHWPVPPGTSVDGASIPKALPLLWGGLWHGKYREAAVVHDYHCAARSADWQSVHRMFYRAMLASGVSEPRPGCSQIGAPSSFIFFQNGAYCGRSSGLPATLV